MYSKIIKISRFFFVLIVITTQARIGFSQVQNFEKVGQNWRTDLTKHSVKLNEIKALMKRDGIPPIDHPVFITAAEALHMFFAHEPVIVIENKGRAKAFPLNILTYHEIVNDSLGDLYFSATYCPLCNAAIAFNRQLTVNGNNYLLDFGVSGMLRNSDLVMWDRQTESWWQQFLGEGIVGRLTGAKLEMLPAQIISLADFVDRFPNGQVLSKNTGFENQQKRYGTNVYEGYDSNPNPRLFSGEIDSRLPAMERVVDIMSGGEFKIYPHSVVAERGVINDSFNQLNVVLFYKEGTRSILDKKEISQAKNIGAITVFERKSGNTLLTFRKKGDFFIDEQTRSRWTITGTCIKGKLKGKQLRPVRYGNHFAFSWFAFHPESEIYN